MIRIIIPFIRLGFHKAVAMRLYSCHRYAVPYLLPIYRGLRSAKAHASPTAGVLSPRCGYRSPLRGFRGGHPRSESCHRYAVLRVGRIYRGFRSRHWRSLHPRLCSCHRYAVFVGCTHGRNPAAAILVLCSNIAWGFNRTWKIMFLCHY